MRFFLIFLGVMMVLTTGVQARGQPEDIRDYHAFGSLPIVHQGRLKPLDSFARITLETFSGSTAFEGRPAIVWLAHTIFDPASAPGDAIFKITNPAVLSQLDLPEDQALYSLNDLSAALDNTREQAFNLLQQEPNSLTHDQKEFLSLHEHVADYTQLLRSLSMILPLSIAVPDSVAAHEDGKPPVYLDLIAMDARIADDVKAIVRRRGADISVYNDEEQQLAMLSFQLSLIREGGSQNTFFKIMPQGWSKAEKPDHPEWFSPWELLLNGEGSPEGREYLSLWRDMAMSYRQGHVQDWRLAVQSARDFAAAHVPRAAFAAERFYQSWNFYHWAGGFYFVAVLLCFAGLVPVSALHERRKRLLQVWSLGAGLGGALVHAAGIGFRMFILARPPVGTLYESVLFVALITAATGLILAWRKRHLIPLLASSIAALALLGIAPIAEPDTESLDMLVAVLNTNFWLGTHVLIITAGYGLCVLLAMVSHAALIMRLARGAAYAGYAALNNMIYKLSLAALLFTAVGTILGGIWADQSWGRFWGWDPKENGALLIVLWLIWAQHGRLSGHLRQVPFTAMMAGLNIIVALAWFGVNLLNVGLHSYGFTSGLALGLGVFSVVQFMVIGGLWAAIRMKENGVLR